jgi:hypothetical protein
MKVNVDKQGWEMIDSGAHEAFEGAAAIDTSDASAGSAGTVLPGSGVFAKVNDPTAAPAEELSVMDTIPAPSSDEPSDIIPRPASVPPDLAALVREADAAERTG